MFDLNFITALLYLAASAGAWLLAQRMGDAASNSQTGQAGWPNVALWLGLGTHAVAIGWALFGGVAVGINIGFSHAISLLVWLTLLSYILVGRDSRLTRLAILYLAPVAALAAAMVVWLPGNRPMDFGRIDFAFGLHVVVAVLAYAMFTVAALHAVLILVLQRQLHAASIASGQDGLPPLMRIEKLMFQLLWIAFVLLTATLASGVFFSEALFGKPFAINHKTVFAVMSWFVFGGLLAGHLFAGWRGTLAVRWTLIGFVMLLLSYIGSKFVLEVILKRV